MISRLPFLQDRRQTFRSVGSDNPRQQVKARFVHENHGSAFLLCTLFDLGPDLRAPTVDRLFVPLKGLCQGDLRRPRKFFQQTRHLAPTVRNAEFLNQDFGNPTTGPDLAPKAVGFSPMSKKVGDQSLLRWGQSCRSSPMGLGTKGLWAAKPGRTYPTAGG